MTQGRHGAELPAEGAQPRARSSATARTPNGAVLHDEARFHDETARGDTPPASGPIVFVPALALFVVGLWLLGLGMDTDSGLLFALGMLASGVAFIVPIHLLRD